MSPLRITRSKISTPLTTPTNTDLYLHIQRLPPTITTTKRSASISSSFYAHGCLTQGTRTPSNPKARINCHSPSRLSSFPDIPSTRLQRLERRMYLFPELPAVPWELPRQPAIDHTATLYAAPSERSRYRRLSLFMAL